MLRPHVTTISHGLHGFLPLAGAVAAEVCLAAATAGQAGTSALTRWPVHQADGQTCRAGLGRAGGVGVSTCPALMVRPAYLALARPSVAARAI
jgi:hypothetical protein